MPDIDAILKAIEENYGEGCVVCGSDSLLRKDFDRIPTGIFAVDYITGGGIPVGVISRIIGKESAGKTALALKIVAGAQKLCRECMSPGKIVEKKGKPVLECPKCGDSSGFRVVWFDAEGVFSTNWAEKFGVVLSWMQIIRTEFAEQGIDIADALLRSGEFDLLVVDSLAHLTPMAEIENSMESWQMGLAARLINKALRKWISAMTAAGATGRAPTMVLINQIRYNIGCFDYHSRVQLADGTSMKIGTLVNQKKKVWVRTFNQKTGLVENRPVINWYKNGKTEEWLAFECEKPGGNGRSQFRCTKEHKILSEKGWVRAKDLNTGDNVASVQKAWLSPEQLDVIKGSLLGDGCVRNSKKSKAKRFKITHGTDQAEYLEMKRRFFPKTAGKTWAYKTEKAVAFELKPLQELEYLRKELYGRVKNRKKFSKEYFSSLSNLALAIWYLDDAHFHKTTPSSRNTGSVTICVEGMAHRSRTNAVEWLNKIGVKSKLNKKKTIIAIGVKGTEELHKKICSFVPSCMQYKLLDKYKGYFEEVKMQGHERMEKVFVKVTGIKGIKKGYWKGVRGKFNKYDIEVEGTGSYVVDSIIVHNSWGSPETTPGGKGQDFASSLDLYLKQDKKEDTKGFLYEGDKTVAMNTHLAVSKSRVGTPKLEGKYRMWLADTINGKTGDTDDVAVVFNYAKKYGTLEKDGTGCVLLGKKFKTQKEAKEEMYKSKDYFAKVREATLEAMYETTS